MHSSPTPPTPPAAVLPTVPLIIFAQHSRPVVTVTRKGAVTVAADATIEELREALKVVALAAVRNLTPPNPPEAVPRYTVMSVRNGEYLVHDSKASACFPSIHSHDEAHDTAARLNASAPQPAPDSGGELPAVAGRRCQRSLADMERAARVLISEHQMDPDGSALIGFLADAVRLCREQADDAMRRLDAIGDVLAARAASPTPSPDAVERVIDAAEEIIKHHHENCLPRDVADLDCDCCGADCGQECEDSCGAALIGQSLVTLRDGLPALRAALAAMPERGAVEPALWRVEYPRGGYEYCDTEQEAIDLVRDDISEAEKGQAVAVWYPLYRQPPAAPTREVRVFPESEATRDPIYLFQRRCVRVFQAPENQDGEEAEHDGEGFQRSDRDGYWTNDELLAAECALVDWDTELVFFTREEGEVYGRARAYNYPDGWRVYSVPAQGAMAVILAERTTRAALTPRAGEVDRG